MEAIELSVVVPVYKCDGCLRSLHQRLSKALGSLGIGYQVLLVDDRSPDGGWEIMKELARSDHHLKLVRLSRNFGQHAAVTAGLAQATGRWTVVMDCDLQDPPEAIAELYGKALQGFDIVHARRVGRRHAWYRRAASAAYFRLLNAVLGTSLTSDYGNFSIISARVRDAFLSFRDKDRHYLMILDWLGFDRAIVDVPHEERFAGKSAYSLGMLLDFAVAGLLFQTTTLLRWIIYAGFVLSGLGGGLAILIVIRYFVGKTYPGWTSLGVLLLLVGGFIITSTGVIGLYVGNVFTQVKDRPLYIVDQITDSEALGVLIPQTSDEPIRRATGEGSPAPFSS